MHLQEIVVAVPFNDYKPLHHKGALKRLSSEKITAAFILAIARDIEKQEADELLFQWRRQLKSTTCRFVLLPMEIN
eukprot:12893466-Prorocentrum_lima.AAC.1